MIHRYPQIMYTDSVKQTQQHYGTRRQGEKMVLDYPNKGAAQDRGSDGGLRYRRATGSQPAVGSPRSGLA
jgi:hypothetical protein